MASLSYANTYSYNLLTLIDEWQRSLVISFIEVDMTDMSLNDQIKNTIHLIGDSLQWISEKYREFREEVFDIPLALRGEIDEDLDKLVKDQTEQKNSELMKIKRIFELQDVSSAHVLDDVTTFNQKVENEAAVIDQQIQKIEELL